MSTSSDPKTSSDPRTPLRRDSDRRGPRTVVPTPRRPVEDAPDWATSTHDCYPGVRYALERLTALRSDRRDDPRRGDRD
jgi:hypothetical protein